MSSMRTKGKYKLGAKIRYQNGHKEARKSIFDHEDCGQLENLT